MIVGPTDIQDEPDSTRRHGEGMDGQICNVMSAGSTFVLFDGVLSMIQLKLTSDGHTDSLVPDGTHGVGGVSSDGRQRRLTEVSHSTT
jgi:hypothetical protein